MAQTIEGFVGTSLDNAKISPLHIKVIALIAAGYFFDVIDLIVLRLAGPGHGRNPSSRPAPRPPLIGSATIFGMFIGTAGQGQFSDRWGRTIHLSVQSAAVRHLHHPRRARAERDAGWSSAASSPASASAPSSRSPSPTPANIRPRRIRGRILAIVHFIGGACVWPIGIAVRAFAFRDADRLARRLDRHRHRRADRLGVPLHAAGIAALSRDPRPGQGSARRARPARHRRARRSRSPPTPRATPRAIRSASCSRMFPMRVIAGMICFSAFFGVAIGLGAWLPNIMTAKGFTITKSLHIHARHELRGAVREHVHDVRARQIRPQDHLGLRLRRRRHHGDRVRQRRTPTRSCWSPASS